MTTIAYRVVLTARFDLSDKRTGTFRAAMDALPEGVRYERTVQVREPGDAPEMTLQMAADAKDEGAAVEAVRAALDATGIAAVTRQHFARPIMPWDVTPEPWATPRPEPSEVVGTNTKGEPSGRGGP